MIQTSYRLPLTLSQTMNHTPDMIFPITSGFFRRTLRTATSSHRFQESGRLPGGRFFSAGLALDGH